MNENSKLLPAILIIGIFVIAIAIPVFFIAKGIYQAEAPLRSVGITNEYQATSTALMSGALTKAAEFNQLIKASTYGSVTLGSVVIASTTAHAMNIYNATSTAGFDNGDYTFITRFSSSTPRGTYTYDIEMDAGLFIQLQAGYTGDYVITYR